MQSYSLHTVTYLFSCVGGGARDILLGGGNSIELSLTLLSLKKKIKVDVLTLFLEKNFF